MGWQSVSIVPPSLNFAGASSNLEIVQLDPWTHGVAEGDDNFSVLSFPNAVAALSDKVGAGDKAVFAIAVSGSTLQGFASQISGLSAAFPVPYFARLKRMAESVDGLKVSRMQLVSPSNSNKSFNIGALPSVQALQKADIKQAAKASATVHSTTNPHDNLTAFASEKTAHDTAVNNARASVLSGLTGATAWRFYSESPIGDNINSGHPDHDHVYTAIMAFLGTPTELSFLRAMFP